MKRMVTFLVFLISTLPGVLLCKNQGPEVTKRVFDAPIDKVYAAAVQAATADANLKSAIKDAYTVSFFTGGRDSYIMTAICTSLGSNQTEVAVLIMPGEDNIQIFRVRTTKDRLRARYWQEMQIALDHMQMASANFPSSAEPSRAFATVSVISTPEGADITVDKKFAGNTPSTVHIPAGDHTVEVAAKGYKPWNRSMTFHEGESVTLRATLEEEQSH